MDEIKTAQGHAGYNLLPCVYKISEKSLPYDYLMDSKPQLITLYAIVCRAVYVEIFNCITPYVRGGTLEAAAFSYIKQGRESIVRFSA